MSGLLIGFQANLVHWSAVTCAMTIYLLSNTSLPPSPNDPLPDRISSWAAILGVSSALLAAIQYAPQLIHTYNIKLVGALSIPMMLIQTPGSVLMVLSIALRYGSIWLVGRIIHQLLFQTRYKLDKWVLGLKAHTYGTNIHDTGWATFAVAGVMQGSLLAMCLGWKVRQKRLGVNDFGQRIEDAETVPHAPADEITPLLQSDSA